MARKTYIKELEVLNINVPNAFKKQMLSMIEDNELDCYNRMLSYFLFLNFNYYIEDKDEQKMNFKLLKESIKKMPDFMKDKIKIDEG